MVQRWLRVGESSGGWIFKVALKKQYFRFSSALYFHASNDFIASQLLEKPNNNWKKMMRFAPFSLSMFFFLISHEWLISVIHLSVFYQEHLFSASPQMNVDNVAWRRLMCEQKLTLSLIGLCLVLHQEAAAVQQSDFIVLWSSNKNMNHLSFLKCNA